MLVPGGLERSVFVIIIHHRKTKNCVVVPGVTAAIAFGVRVISKKWKGGRSADWQRSRGSSRSVVGLLDTSYTVSSAEDIVDTVSCVNISGMNSRQRCRVFVR